MKVFAGLASISLAATACHAASLDDLLGNEVQAAFWLVSDPCTYSTDQADLSSIRDALVRYENVREAAAGTSDEDVFERVEEEIIEQRTRMDIDCPATNSPEAIAQLTENAARLNVGVDNIETLLPAPNS